MNEHTTSDENKQSAYISKCVELANRTNKLYHELETLINLEGDRQTKTRLLDNLVEIEAFCDELAEREQKRAAYVHELLSSANTVESSPLDHTP